MQEQNEARGFTVRQIEGELKRLRRKQNSRRIFRQTVFSLLVVAAVAVLAAMLFFPIFRVTGSSMEPTLQPKEIVVCLKSSRFQSGDLVAFYYNNKVLLKRVIGTAGDTIEIDDSGNVFVNGSQLDEPYITKKKLGQCDIDFPYQVPDNRIFVMGDNRETSVDSRTTAVGCIADEYVIGKVFLRVWPLERLGFLD
ncbi:signal peptidase I [Ruminococcus champanellensis]|uniref:Signal peptidase I n=1 Tax=Ruminococcus champanellensis (strain DSM 18848 / JCM 17042 / KCTC 15320 / 18P13) TaxID=213810 RepID=D4LAP8_RUMC1|nr:signal peptidase I [Ruminococcus champanellensis]CBL16693.1 signal peptidase I, bacterial type [Ruminococcus champanellensis 18P13 = JCM 17042]